MPPLADFVSDIVKGRLRVIDLTHTLSPEFPTIVLPPQFGQCAPFRIEEISHYDEHGANHYWNNFSCGEHSGTHFDAPIHWISGKDLPNNSVDTIEVTNFIAAACVIDCSREVAADADFLLTVPRIKEWESAHGRIPPRSWVLFRTDWGKIGRARLSPIAKTMARTHQGRRPRPFAFWSMNATCMALASRRSTPTPASRASLRRPIPRISTYMARAAMGCSACEISTSCHRPVR